MMGEIGDTASPGVARAARISRATRRARADLQGCSHHRRPFRGVIANWESALVSGALRRIPRRAASNILEQLCLALLSARGSTDARAVALVGVIHGVEFRAQRGVTGSPSQWMMGCGRPLYQHCVYRSAPRGTCVRILCEKTLVRVSRNRRRCLSGSRGNEGGVGSFSVGASVIAARRIVGDAVIIKRRRRRRKVGIAAAGRLGGHPIGVVLRGGVVTVCRAIGGG